MLLKCQSSTWKTIQELRSRGASPAIWHFSITCHLTQVNALRLNPSQTGWCRGKFFAPGKFFPPLYCHNVTNANPNPNANHNLNPSPNPNPNLNPTPNLNPNPKFNPILNLNSNPYCCVWEKFSGVTNFPLHRYSTYLPRKDGRLSWPWCWLYTDMAYLLQTVTNPVTTW